MGIIRNILALIGLLALIAAGIGYAKFGGLLGQAGEFREEMAALDTLDPKAAGVYQTMWQKLKQTGNSADATVWVYPVVDGATPEAVESAMKFKANELNIKGVGELPLSEQVELETGEKQRFLKIFQFCNPQTAMRMVAYSDAFSAYLPCRIALVEGEDGQYRLYSLNMDIMIYGGKTLPPALKAEAEAVKDIIIGIMEQGASGEEF
ncbi:MAG: DUF302 domain-containing protein [Thiothrix sp.]|nr:DUF302 domain-containing protein [Thiothrix sp.]HPQ94266.1 DUF302 domain-containing protein [Thiolinea sp.]